MEQTAVSLQAMQMIGATSGRSAMQMAGGTSLAAGDPFLAIIQNMIAQMLEGQAADPGTGQPTPAAAKNGAADETPEQQALLQGFAAMLMADPTLVSQLMQQQSSRTDPETAQAVAALTGQTQQQVPTAVEAALAQTLSPETVLSETPLPQSASAQAVLPEAVLLQTTLPQAVQSPRFTLSNNAPAPISAETPNGQTDQAATLPPAFSGVVTQLRYTETATQPDAAQNQDTLLAQHQFQNAVSAAKRKLQPEPAVDLQELFPEKIQPATVAPTMLKAEAPVQEAKVLDQLTGGISENLAKGNSEFTIKLKPEALGEITVKLVRTDGKTTLSISAANSQTAKLINNDLSALRDAVRPMQVEVHEAVHETPQSSSQMQQQFNQTSQQFSDQRRAFAWQNEQNAHRGAPMADDEDFLAQVLGQPAAPNGLNVYV